MTYYPVATRTASFTTIRRQRLLPARGNVLVRPGDLVESADIIARCPLPGKLWVVDVSQALGVHRAQATKYIRKASGDTLQANEELAGFDRRSGRKSCRSPVAGQVMAIRAGRVLVETASTFFELRAHLGGQVVGVMPERGVMISKVGALIQGVWGSGGEALGRLKLVVEDPQAPLDAASLGEDCRDSLVVAGRILEEEALEQAKEAHVQGLIVGSVSAELCPVLQSLPYPVLVMEGFGPIPMSQHAFSLLQSCAGREAALSAEFQTCWRACPEQRRRAGRPEVLIPLEGAGDVPGEVPGLPPLQVGLRVRGLRDPFLGAVGTIADLPPLPQRVESGARLPVAEVDLDAGESVLIPLANLGLIY
ncbi:hypothetical protein ACFLYD_02025 [Chloroflexota bacterium]